LGGWIRCRDLGEGMRRTGIGQSVFVSLGGGCLGVVYRMLGFVGDGFVEVKSYMGIIVLVSDLSYILEIYTHLDLTACCGVQDDDRKS
jgi:hypothetical protein